MFGSALTTPVVASSGTWLYASACVLLPLAWGVVTEIVFRAIEKRRNKPTADGAERHFLIEYHI